MCTRCKSFTRHPWREPRAQFWTTWLEIAPRAGLPLDDHDTSEPLDHSSRAHHVAPVKKKKAYSWWHLTTSVVQLPRARLE